MRHFMVAAMVIASSPLFLARAEAPLDLELEGRASPIDAARAQQVADELRASVRPGAAGQRVELVLRHVAEPVVTRSRPASGAQVLSFPPDMVERSRAAKTKRASQGGASSRPTLGHAPLDDQLLREASRLSSGAGPASATRRGAPAGPGGRLHALPPAGGWGKRGRGQGGAQAGSAGGGAGGAGGPGAGGAGAGGPGAGAGGPGAGAGGPGAGAGPGGPNGVAPGQGGPVVPPTGSKGPGSPKGPGGAGGGRK